MSARDRLTLILGFTLLAAMGIFSALRIEMETDITVFMPEGSDEEARTLSEFSSAIAHGELTRTMVIALRAGSLSETLEASRALEARLNADEVASNRLAYIEGGPPPDYERAIYELFFPRRFDYLARDLPALEARLSDEALDAAADALLDRLASPTSTMLTQIAPRDPFLAFPAIFDNLARSGHGDLSVVDGRYLSQHDESAILFLATRADAFNTHESAPLIGAIEEAIDALRELYPGLIVDQSGVHRFALRAEEMIKTDIARISTLSALLLSVLLLLLFRSLRFIALASLPIGAGMLAGLSASLLLFGRVHGISLAFGASMLGVTIDYVVHLYAHQALAPAGHSPKRSLKAIDRTLMLCAASTSVGFIALLFAPLPGLREVALFAMIGVIVSLLTTRAFLPILMPAAIPETRARALFVRALEASLGTLRSRRLLGAGVFLAAIGFAALSLPALRDSLDKETSLTDPSGFDRELMLEDQRVRDRITRVDQRRFIAAIGETEIDALAAHLEAGAIASASINAGELESYLALDGLLVDPGLALSMRERLRSDEGLPARLDRAFTRAGFNAGSFEPFFDDLHAPIPSPLSFDELMDSPLRSLARSMRVELSDGRIAFLLFLSGVNEIDALSARVAQHPSLLFVDQSDLMGGSEAMGEGRVRILILMALLGVFSLIFARQRSLRAALAALLPSLVAAIFTLTVLVQLGRPIDLILATTLLLVVCMGVDFGVFLVDAERSDDALKQRSSLLAIALSAMTTMMGFGLLSSASHPLLASIGLTAMMGIFACLLLAPSAIALLGLRAKKDGEKDKAQRQRGEA